MSRMLVFVVALTLTVMVGGVGGGSQVAVAQNQDDKPRFFVVGEVQKPGEFTLASGITVGRAIDLAGGLTDRAIGRFQIRRLVDGKPVSIAASREDEVLHRDTVVVQARFF